MRLFHWISGISFLFAIFLGIILTHTEYLKQNEIQYILLHKSFGLLVFFLTIMRITTRLFSEIPDPIAKNKLELVLEKITHYGLYFFLFSIPLSGYLMSSFGGRATKFFNLFSLPLFVEKNNDISSMLYEVHEIIAYTALIFVGLHLLGTAKHLIIDKNNILKRIV